MSTLLLRFFLNLNKFFFNITATNTYFVLLESHNECNEGKDSNNATTSQFPDMTATSVSSGQVEM
jgi:hypothetical protein